MGFWKRLYFVLLVPSLLTVMWVNENEPIKAYIEETLEWNLLSKVYSAALAESGFQTYDFVSYLCSGRDAGYRSKRAPYFTCVYEKLVELGAAHGVVPADGHFFAFEPRSLLWSLWQADPVRVIEVESEEAASLLVTIRAELKTQNVTDRFGWYELGAGLGFLLATPLLSLAAIILMRLLAYAFDWVMAGRRQRRTTE